MNERADAFYQGFLDIYLERGFGSMQKRDIDILVMKLLMEQGFFEEPDNFFAMSRVLRISETKVRNLIADVQMRYGEFDDAKAKAKEKFLQLIQNNDIQAEGDYLIFIIRDPLLRQYFDEWVTDAKSFTDTSFNKNVVKIKITALKHVLKTLIANDSVNIEKVKENMPQEYLKGNDVPTLMDDLCDGIVSAAKSKASTEIVNGLCVAGSYLLMTV